MLRDEEAVMTKSVEALKIKQARGTKRTCQSGECAARFYDLNRTPIICPVCTAPYVIPSTPVPRATEWRRVKKIDYPIVDETAPETAPSNAQAALEEAEREDQSAAEENEPVLEVEEEEGSDVSNILGGPLDEKEKES